jgi:hypothetical protein
MSKKNNEAKELATKVAQLRIAIAPESESKITIQRFKGRHLGNISLNMEHRG